MKTHHILADEFLGFSGRTLKQHQFVGDLGGGASKQRILESITDGFYCLDQNWCFTYVNKFTENILGKTKDKLIGRNIWNEFPQVFGNKVFRKYSKALATKKTIQFEHFSRKINRWLHIHVYPSNEGLSVYFNDVTQRKQIEEVMNIKVEASKILAASLDYKITLDSMAKLIVEHIADLCCVELINYQGQLEVVALAHKELKRLHRIKDLEKESMPNLSTVYGLGKAIKTGEVQFYPIISKQWLQKINTTELEINITQKINPSSMMIVPLESNGIPIGAITFILTGLSKRYTQTDLQLAEQLASRASLAIERARLYEDLKQEKEHLNDLISNVPGIVWESVGKSLDTQKMSYVSGFVEKLLGYSQDEWLSQSDFWLKIMHPDDQARSTEEFESIYKKGSGTIRSRLITKDGRVIWVEIQASIVRYSQESIGLRGVTMDISQRVELEKRKDEFISIASHELKTPVATIKGFTQIIQLLFDNNPQAQYYLTKMNFQIDRLTILVNDLLDVSKIQSGKLSLKKEEFYLNELINDTVEDIVHINPKHHIQINNQTPVLVSADRYRIGQVLVNLLSNAIKFSPKADEVIVSSEVRDSFAIVKVQDFGIGISKKNLKKVFGRFYQVENTIRQSFSGLGLGLYISHQIIRRHGGKIWVQSEKGVGSTFFFELPINPKYKRRRKYEGVTPNLSM